jgi:hypothetical protein
MQEKPSIRIWELVVLAVVTGVLIWLCLGYIQAQPAAMPEHSGRSIMKSVTIWLRLASGLPLLADDYPPLSYLASAACYALFGFSHLVALGSQVLFLPLLLVGAWWIGRELGGRGGGMLCLLAAAGNPWLPINLTAYFLEVGTLAMVAVFFALLLASRGGRVPWPTFGLGLAMGLGMLSKWSFLFFTAPALLWPLTLAWKAGRGSRMLALACLACLLLTTALFQDMPIIPDIEFPASHFVRALGAWVWLAVGAAWIQRRDGWSPGVGMSWAFTLAFLVCGWWYFLSASTLLHKAGGDLAQSFPVGKALSASLGSLGTCIWLAPLWLVLGTVVGLAIRPLRIPTLCLLGGILTPLVIYTQAGIPLHPRYILPATVLLTSLGFGWWGRVRWLPPLLAPGLLFLGLYQLGCPLPERIMPPHYLTLEMTDQGKMSWLIPRYTTNDSLDRDIGPIAERVMAELEKSHELRITALIQPGTRGNVDGLMFEGLLKKRVVLVENFRYDDPAPHPATSLVLTVGRPELMGNWLSEYELIATWSEDPAAPWALYRHPTRREDHETKQGIEHLPWPEPLFGP